LYSLLSAVTGSTRAARVAGITYPAIAIPVAPAMRSGPCGPDTVRPRGDHAPRSVKTRWFDRQSR
jgi:hypothetical protein